MNHERSAPSARLSQRVAVRMHATALPYLVSPKTGERLSLQVFSGSGDWIAEGVLQGGKRWYPIIAGLPIFPSETLRIDLSEFCSKHGLRNEPGRPEHHVGQTLTNLTFSHKWNRFKNYGLEPSHQHFLQDWYAKKLGLGSAADLP